MATLFRDLVSQAFEEGSRLPYEMKPYVVEEITRAVPVGIPAKLDAERLARYLGDRLPPVILDYLHIPNVYLCGGAILKCICDPTNRSGSWRNSDYDLYCHTDAFNALRPHLKNLSIDAAYVNAQDSSFRAYRAVVEDKPLNLIVSRSFTSAANCIDQFDLTIVQVAYYRLPTVGLFFGQRSWGDIAANRIYLNPDAKFEKGLTATKSRIKKYIKRGFRDMTRLVEVGFKMD